MEQVIEWLVANWLKIAVPLLAFLATYIVGLWLRRVVHNVLERWVATWRWEGGQVIVRAVHRPFIYWFLLLGILVAVQVSVLSPLVKGLSALAIGTLFVLSLGWVILQLAEQLVRLYFPRIKVSQSITAFAINVIRFAIILVTLLVALDMWGVPTTPLLAVIVLGILIALVVFRNAATNVSAGVQLGAAQQIRVGDYIKLESGEEGYVTELTWSNTQIRALDQSIIIVPNIRLLQQTIINYGKPLKKAKDSFHFHSRTHFTELTGLKAKNLRELVDILRKVPDAVIYFHTHHFLEEQYYLTPQLSNDFAVWVTGALGDEVLAERLASIDTFGFPNLGALRERIIATIEEYLSGNPPQREAMPDRDFHFMKSVSFILPTAYAVHDLREFIEALRKISLGSLFFHVFDARLRLGRGMNDFSIWLQDSLGDTELAEEIARLDPYTFTLEGLRLALIQLIEKRME